MSTLYNVEPNPTAKVILKTTAGDLSLELFAKQTPLASRSFLQHCLDGYYEGTIFHRLVPGFIIQGGDPTGTGSGGESALEGGTPFADEFHSRLRFNRRGLLGMANSGTKDDNASQFFLTLGKADELNSRHTMFGRIEGDTIYNLVKMGEGELAEEEGSERPMYPYRVTGSEILVNPFEGMEPRTKVVHSKPSSKDDSKRKPKKKAGKQMLSFGGGDDEDGHVPAAKKPKFNPKLVKATEIEQKSKTSPHKSTKEERKSKVQVDTAPEKPKSVDKEKVSLPPRKNSSDDSDESDSNSESDEPLVGLKPDKLAKTREQIAELKKSLKRENPAPAEDKPRRHKSALEMMIPAGAKRGVKAKPGGKDEQRALDAFAAFQSRIKQTGNANVSGKLDAKAAANTTKNGDEPEPPSRAALEEDVCDLHFVPNCESCKKWDEAEEDGEDDINADDLINHKLSFAKDRLGKDLEWKRQNEKELVVIDPREREKEILSNQKAKGKQKR